MYAGDTRTPPPNRSDANRKERKHALPGRGGLSRIADAARNSWRGIAEGLATEAAIKQEIAIALFAVPVSVFIARDIWVWLALMGSLLFVLAVEFLNTAVERLCNHVSPQKHNAIRVTKDLASAGVFFALLLAGLVWVAILLERLGVLA